MTRPRYLSDEDRRHEDEVAEVIGAAWGCEVGRFPGLTEVDWFLYRDDRIVALAELKTHRETFGTYREVILSAHKLVSLLDARHAFHVPAFLVIEFADGIRWANVDDVEVGSFRLSGRTDRNDPRDREPCAFLTLDAFHLIPREEAAS